LCRALIDDLKDLINEILENESIARSAGNELHCNGLAQARVMLETRLEKHGISRISTISNFSDIVVCVN
jgi:hypothetical protein